EALRQELHGSGVDLSVVMPVVVNTALGSGLPQTRGYRPVETQDVADAIVEALQTGRFEVFEPKSLKPMLRGNALMPRRMVEAIARFMKSDQVLAHPDLTARSAYDMRIAGPAPPAPEAAPETREPEKEAV